jgi:hypothetical protein
MSTFCALRMEAGLTISGASSLLGIKMAKAIAYENGELIPQAKEIQVLRGLAKIARMNAGKHLCEPDCAPVTNSPNLRSVAKRKSYSLKNTAAEKNVDCKSSQFERTGPDFEVAVSSSNAEKQRAAGRHPSANLPARMNRPNQQRDPAPAAARPRFKIICGDSLDVLRALPPASVDMCMTSPPYWGHREYDVHGIGQELNFEAYIAGLCNILQEVKRVLKAEGSLWLNIGDSYQAKNLVGIPWRVALRLVDHGGWILRNDVIWNKVKGAPDNSPHTRACFSFRQTKNLFLRCGCDTIETAGSKSRERFCRFCDRSFWSSLQATN